MTTPSRSRRALAASISLLLLTPLGLLATSSSADAHPVAGAAVQAAEPPAGATAGDFLFYKFPLPACAGVGLNVSAAPYFSRTDCGFANFTLSGDAEVVQAKLFTAGSDTAFATLDAAEDSQTPGDYQVDLAPAGDWPAGIVTLRVLADGEPAGETTFGHNLLQVTFDETTGATAPGDDIPVSGTVVELDNDGPADTSDAGVPATFTLRATLPDGSTADSRTVTAADDGTFDRHHPRRRHERRLRRPGPGLPDRAVGRGGRRVVRRRRGPAAGGRHRQLVGTARRCHLRQRALRAHHPARSRTASCRPWAG